MSRRVTVTLTAQDVRAVQAFTDADRPESALLGTASRELGIPLGPGASEQSVGDPRADCRRRDNDA